VVTWYSAARGNCLLRAAQPKPGLAGAFSGEDAAILHAYRATSPDTSQLVILDARSQLAADGNRLKGSGTEDPDKYGAIKLIFSDIANIHAMRRSGDELKASCQSTSLADADWLLALHRSAWPAHVMALLRSATTAALYLAQRGVSLLVHCSDGWDRTPQICALVQLLLDGYYRTLEGFPVLVEKEFVAFGHKFRERLGLSSHEDERSPIFLQFLDCVFQLTRQFPRAFEFGPAYLARLATLVLGGVSGSFACDSLREREAQGLERRSLSVWSFLDCGADAYRNRQFRRVAQTLVPICSTKRFELWSDFYLRLDETRFPAQFIARASAAAHPASPAREASAPPRSPNALGREPPGAFDRAPTRQVVPWEPDEWRTTCSECNSKFTLWRRRSHCRACGRLFCSNCVPHRMALPHLSYFDEVKVCAQCFANGGHPLAGAL
jgi:hypothetical protein